jgi:hypothetical protein
MVLLPGCVCCTAEPCGFPYLSPYSVEVSGYTSWAFRCGRPAGTSASGGGSGSYVYTPSDRIRTAATALCDAVGGLYYPISNGSIIGGFALGGGHTITNDYFRPASQSSNTYTLSPLAAIYGPLSGQSGARIQLDINHTVNQGTGLVSWTFRASGSGDSGYRWRNATPFYSQTLENRKCVNDASLNCCGGAEFFHLPTPTTFSFSHSGVTVGYNGSSELYPWTSYQINFSYGYSSLLASDFDGTYDAVIQKYTACFANCNYSTNLCCNPLP